MDAFVTGHAAHPDWRVALAMAAAQIDAQAARQARTGAYPARLGMVYFSDHYAPHAEDLLAALRKRWPGLSWVGCAGVGVAASGVEYFDEPALALMLCPFAPGQFRVFSGNQPLTGFDTQTMLVHADPATPDLTELIGELSERTASGYLFGGVVASRTVPAQIANGVWRGGLSGVAFTADVALVSRVTQGCQPVGPVREVTAAEHNLVLALDGRPALECLLADLGLEVEGPRVALPRLRATLVGLSDAPDALVGNGRAPARARHRAFGSDVRVHHIVGLDPVRQGVALADIARPGMRLAFCARSVDAARRDLVRICTEIRDELETRDETARQPVGAAIEAPAPPRRVAGAVYISCVGRGGPHFGGPSAELAIVRQALGDVPLVGFFAAGEIAHRHLYGYTGVLTVFTGGT